MSNRKHTIESYAAYWWTENTGESDRWEDLDAQEREAVIENSMAETVADWLEDTKWADVSE